MRHLQFKHPVTVLKAALRRIGAKNACNYMRGCGLIIPRKYRARTAWRLGLLSLAVKVCETRIAQQNGP